VGKPGFPIPPPGRRVWEGFALPGSRFIPSVCGGAAWRTEVTIVRRVQPPPSLPPLGGGAGCPPPAGAGQGRGGHRARGAAMRASRPRSQGMVIATWCAMRMTVSREHRPQGRGKTGFPHPPAGRGDGETGFPHPPTRWEGLGGLRPPRNNRMFIMRTRIISHPDERRPGGAGAAGARRV